MNPEPKSKHRPWLMLLALAFVLGPLACSGFAQRLPEAAHGPSVAAQLKFAGKPGDYIGWQTCAGCHRAEAQAFAKTPHAALGGESAAPPAAATAGLSASAAAGKKLYDDMMCAGCHKIAGQGGEGGPALDDIGATRTRAELRERMVKSPAGSIMPALPSDTPEQKINDLLDYMGTLKGGAAKAEAAPAPTGVSGCETCHGPGRAHAQAEQSAAGDPAKVLAGTKLIFSFNANPKENAERCLTCHITGKQQDGFEHSQHALAGVSCDQCHSPHLVKKVENKASLNLPQQAFYQLPQLPETARWLHSSLLKESQPNLCFTCHGNIQAQFALPIHHRVPEGLMKCTDCHNPHGSINRASLNAPQWEACVKCHVEKRGPFVYEHAAVRVEGCVVCHTPHGSTNRLLLKRREGRQICLQCHTGFHTQAQVPHGRMGYQTSGECTRCHVAIHGSVLDQYFLR